MPQFLVRCMTLFLMLSWGGALSGQPANVTGVLHRAGNDTVFLRDVEIALTPGDWLVRTDSVGQFRIIGVNPGRYLLVARRIGLESVFKTIEVPDGRALRMKLSMFSIAQELATITVSGRRVTYPIRLSEPYARMARGTGSYFTREQIDSLFPLDLKSLLVRLPGVRIAWSSIAFVRCQELGKANQRLQVYIDGVRMTKYELPPPITASEVLRDISPASVQLMEVYTGSVRVPADYAMDACGVVLIWTK